MDERIRQFLADAKAMRLTREEWRNIRDSILHLQSSDAPFQLNEEEKAEGKISLQGFMAECSSYQGSFFTKIVRSLHSPRMVSAAAVLIIVIGTTGGVAYAAEGSSPGHPLYSIKIRTEEVREYFHRNPVRKAEWTQKRMERRLAELEVLLNEPERHTELIEKLQARMEQHSQKLEKHLEHVQSSEKLETIRARMDQRLQQHEEFLTKLQSGNLTEEDKQKFLQRVRQKREHMGKWKRGGLREKRKP